jgi:hypothetical protein
MNNLFVKKDEIISVKIYVGTNKDATKIFADLSSEKLTKNNPDVEKTTIEEHTVNFRKPNYGNLVEMMKNSVKTDGITVEINPVVLRHSRLIILTKDWTFKDEDGNPIKVTTQNIENLSPIIADVIASGLEEELI